MRFAYADPPYLGMGKLYAHLHPEAAAWDDPEQHRRLIEQLTGDFPDGWAMSASSPSLRTLLPMCPEDVRVGAWVKPFAIFKPNVPVAYAWEPVIWRGGRRRGRDEATCRDWVSENVTLKKGTPGAKPRGFSFWVFDLLGAAPGDELVDMFPGSQQVTYAWAEFQAQRGPAPGLPFDPVPIKGAA